MLRIIDIDQAGELLSRNNSRLDSAIETVKPIIDDVRLRGDAALFEYAKKFDDLDGSSFAYWHVVPVCFKELHVSRPI